MIKLHGIRNCDTVKKARRWLDQHDLAHQFVDFKKSPPDHTLLEQWCKQLDWQLLVNRRGTTWRKLSDNDKQDLNQPKAIALMQQNPSLIKRPVWQIGDQFALGFDEAVRQQLSAL